jgi:rhamnosyltransferase subunit B
MAFFVFSTYGTRGDILPYIAIGTQLQTRGHRVLIATSPAFQREVESNGLEWCQAAPPDPTLEQQERIAHPRFGTNFLLRELVLESLKTNITQLQGAVQGADVLISHTNSLAGPIVAELERARGLKWASSVVSPLALFTNDVSLSGSPSLANLPLLNWYFVRSQKKRYGRLLRPVKKIRAGFGLSSGSNPISMEAHSEQLQLCLWPEKFAWSYTHLNRVYCGFPFRDYDNKIATDIEAFLNSGTPPIVFVNDSYLETEEWAAQSVAAAAMVKQRALLIGGPELTFSNDVLCRPFVDLPPLFERAAAIVHRGDIGTTALAMRSGKPVVIAPAYNDQPDNARRTRKLGLAQISSQYTASSLAQALEYSLSKDTFKYVCAIEGPRVATGNGAIVAADALEILSRQKGQ